MIKKTLPISFLAIGLFMLSACGFHLRGTVNYPDALKTLYIQSTPQLNAFANRLKATLGMYHVTLVNSSKNAPLTLDLMSDSLTLNQITVGSSQETRDYSVTYTVNYRILNQAGKTLVGPRAASDQSTVTAQPNEVLDNNTPRVAGAKRTLEQKVIYKLLLQLSSKNTLKALG